MKIKILEPCLSAAKQVGDEIILENAALQNTKHPDRFLYGENPLEALLEDSEFFFYKISCHNDSRYPMQCCEERGIGYLKNGRLIRTRLIGWINTINGETSVESEEFHDFCEDGYITVGEYVPTIQICRSYVGDVIISSNCVIKLEPNQHIYCDENGELQTGTPKELHAYINSLDKPVPFTHGINVKPSNRPKKSKIGDIIFNKNSARLEYYDGSVWLEIGTEE